MEIRNNLLKTAADLPEAGIFAEEYLQKMTLLCAELNKLMLEREDLKEIVGPENLPLMQDNHTNHAKFMYSIFSQFNAEILVDTILWVFRAYRSRGFHSLYWSVQLNGWLTVLEKHMSTESFSVIQKYYSWMIINIPGFVLLSDGELNESHSAHRE